ncbi:MAG TPA: ABC transporter substrate-binding protein [Actinomycetota bacterium]|jgi:osmoprotectant transport system substrate-binding protein
MRKPRRIALGATLLALSLFAAACGSGESDENGGTDAGGGDEAKGSLTVGAVGFAENQIVAEMYAQVLENAGYEVNRQVDLKSREILQPAMRDGEVDVAPEYTGSLLLFLDPDATPPSDGAAGVEANNELLAEYEMTMLEPSEANDTNGFFVTQETADEHGLTTTSDLAPVAGDLTLGGPPECPERPFCIPGLEDTYGITFGEFRPLDVGGPLTVAALKKGEIDVALLFTTSSAIEANGFVTLEDDKGLQPAEAITPVIRDDANSDEVTSLLNEVSAALTTEAMIELNSQVELEHEDAADVAQGFLEEEGLL